MSGAAPSGSTADREIVTARHIAGPPRVVFQAFTTPEHLGAWWGPTGFRITKHAFEFRAGGVWDYTMHGPDGTDYPNWVQWREIVPGERIVLIQGIRADDPNQFETTVTFADHEGGTLLTMRALFASKAARDQVIERYDAAEGARQTLGRLAALVDAGAVRTR